MKPINNQAPVQSTNSILIHATPETVWAVLSNINTWPTWQTDVKQARLNGPLQPNTTFDWKSGGAKVHSVLHTVTPVRQLGWTGNSLGTFAIHNWTLTERNGATEVRVEESLDGFLAKLLRGMFNKMLAKGMQKSLDQLKAACE
ncbi:SRPBCC family protein [Spirosoma areae]